MPLRSAMLLIRPCLLIGLTLLSPLIFDSAIAEESRSSSLQGLSYFDAPKPLSPEAVTADWPRFLGPTDDGKTSETQLLDRFPETGLKKVWEWEKGTSYTSPAIVDGRLFTFNCFDDDEVLHCLDPENGTPLWESRYPVEYSDRYGFNKGPRASPVIADGYVFTLGVTSVVTCHEVATGKRLWQRKLAEEFDRKPYFFGHGCAPLVHKGKVIIPLGTEDDRAVFALDVKTGETLWTTIHPWQAGYASPIIATLQGKERLLVFAGDDSRPPAGGLLCIDPENGELLDAYPFRADKYESVNGATPVVVGEDRVFISASYGKGSAMLRLNASLKWELVWENEGFGMHWSTPLLKDGYLYGFQGRNEPDAYLAALSVETGEEVWQADPEWAIPGPGGRDYRMKYFRGSILQADGRSYILGEFGSLGIAQLTPTGIEEIDHTQLFVARATWSLPVLHRGLLYIVQHERSMDGEAPRLICYDLRK